MHSHKPKSLWELAGALTTIKDLANEETRVVMIPVSVIPIPIPIQLGRISIAGFPKIHDSDSNSYSSGK